ncbi:hypothetical protein MC885_011886, partial [Smutsia gigantea]
QQAPAAASGCAPAPPPPGGPRGLQPAGGGALRPRRGDRLPCSLHQLDSAALRMLLVDANQPQPVRRGARELALFLTPEPGAEAKAVEETIEVMLLRLEEFCSLTDLIRSDTSQILEEHIPVLKAKVTEMRGIYAKVDQLEAFVKMVGHHVSFLEAHVLRAERDHGAFLQALQRWLGSAGLPSFKNTWGPPGLPVVTCSRKCIPARELGEGCLMEHPPFPTSPQQKSTPEIRPRTIFLWMLGKRRFKPPAANGTWFGEAVGTRVWQSLRGDLEEPFSTRVQPAWCSRTRLSRLRSHLALSLGTEISLFHGEGLCVEVMGLT